MSAAINTQCYIRTVWGCRDHHVTLISHILHYSDVIWVMSQSAISNRYQYDVILGATAVWGRINRVRSTLEASWYLRPLHGLFFSLIERIMMPQLVISIMAIDFCCVFHWFWCHYDLVRTFCDEANAYRTSSTDKNTKHSSILMSSGGGRPC